MKACDSSNLPILSIITVSYNAVSTIETTIQSVVKQTYPSIEYIIIDGGSTDGTIDVINKYSKAIRYWISEPDKGIYDAMNKGIEKAMGDYFFFLGDDQLISPTIISSIFTENIKDYSLIYGNVIYTSGNVFYSKFTNKLLIHNTIHHQAAFYNRILFDNFRYTTNFKLLSDYELNIRIYINRLPVKKLNFFISKCTDGGVSRTNYMLAFKEANEIRSFYISKKKNLLFSFIYAIKLFVNYVRYRCL